MRSWAFILCFAAFLPAVASETSSPEAPIEAPVRLGFEKEMPEGLSGRLEWLDNLLWRWDATQDRFASIDDTVAHTGEKSLKIAVPKEKADLEGWHPYCVLNVPVEPGRHYGLRVRLKTDDATSPHDKRPGATVFMQWNDAQGRWAKSGGTFVKGGAPSTGTHDWCLLEIPFTQNAVPPDVTHIGVGLCLAGAGTAWFDDLEVFECGGSGIALETPTGAGEGDTIKTSRPTFEWEEAAAATPADNHYVYVGQGNFVPARNWVGRVHPLYELQISPSGDFLSGATDSYFTFRKRFMPPAFYTNGFWRVKNVFFPGFSRTARFVVDVPSGEDVTPPVVRAIAAQTTAIDAVIEDDPAGSGVDPRSVRLEIDGASIDGPPMITGDRFCWKRKLSPGAHEVTISAADFAGNGERVTREVLAPGDIRRTAVSDDGMLLVDGERVFPICAMRHPEDGIDLAAMQMLKDAGFNVVHQYGWYKKRALSAEVLNGYLDAAEQAGLLVLVSFSRSPLKGDFKNMEMIVRTARTHPATMGYYLADEPTRGWRGFPIVWYMDRRVKALDPFHVTSVLPDVPADFGLYRSYHVGDVIQRNYYPVQPSGKPQYPLSEVTRGVAELESRFPNAACWAMVQAFDYDRYLGKSKEMAGQPHRPSPHQIRNMTYQAITAGAKGVSYYFAPSRYYSVLKETPRFWEGLCDVTREIRYLSPVLAAEAPPVAGFTVADAPFISVRTFAHKGVATVIAVNCDDQTREATFALPVAKHSEVAVEELFKDRIVQVEDGKLADSFGPFDVHVYRFSPGG